MIDDHSAMNALPQNSNQLNRAALKWLKLAVKDDPSYLDPSYLHLLNLAGWGVHQKVQGEWPDSHRHAIEDQVALMWGWKPANVMAWFVSNSNGPDKEEQQENLRLALVGASSARSAAALVLSEIYSRMQSELPAPSARSERVKLARAEPPVGRRRRVPTPQKEVARWMDSSPSHAISSAPSYFLLYGVFLERRSSCHSRRSRSLYRSEFRRFVIPQLQSQARY